MLAGVVTGEADSQSLDLGLDPVSELGEGPSAKGSEEFLPTQAPQTENRSPALSSEQFREKRAAILDFRRKRLIAGRGAVRDCGNEDSLEPQAVRRVVAGGLVGKAGAMKGAVKPIPRPVAREHSPGTVGAVRRGRKSYDQLGCLGVAEIRYGPSPVLPIPKACPLFLPHPLSPFDEPRAVPATLDPLVQSFPRHVSLWTFHRIMARLRAIGSDQTLLDVRKMPIYEYEPLDRDCLMCSGRVEVIQGISDPPLVYCPYCGLGVKRVISKASIAVSKKVDPEKAAERGFSTFRRVGKGAWEKVAGPGDSDSPPPTDAPKDGVIDVSQLDD